MQIMTLAKQMYPRNTQHFLQKYEETVQRPYRYLFVDLKLQHQITAHFARMSYQAKKSLTSAPMIPLKLNGSGLIASNQVSPRRQSSPR